MYSFESQPTVKLNLQEESKKMIQLKIFQNQKLRLNRPRKFPTVFVKLQNCQSQVILS